MKTTCEGSSPTLTLEVPGKIPSFKNCKRICGDRLVTSKHTKARMREIESSILYALLCAFQADTGKTLTGVSLRSWIVSSTPGDDCWTNMPRLTIEGELCEKGKEGATIMIDKMKGEP
jgi:hypothetical protein